MKLNSNTAYYYCCFDVW